MANYIQFVTVDNNTILVEVNADEGASSEGVVKAGLGDRLKQNVIQAQSTFEEALEGVILNNARALLRSVRNLQHLPDTIEVTFALKATGEAQVFAVAKGGGEANFTVKLAWKRDAQNQERDSR